MRLVFGVWGLGLRVYGSRLKEYAFSAWVWGLGLRVCGSRLKEYAFSVWGLGFGVWG